jgi:hypothetical protein
VERLGVKDALYLSYHLFIKYRKLSHSLKWWLAFQQLARKSMSVLLCRIELADEFRKLGGLSVALRYLIIWRTLKQQAYLAVWRSPRRTSQQSNGLRQDLLRISRGEDRHSPAWHHPHNSDCVPSA